MPDCAEDEAACRLCFISSLIPHWGRGGLEEPAGLAVGVFFPASCFDFDPHWGIEGLVDPAGSYPPVPSFGKGCWGFEDSADAGLGVLLCKAPSRPSLCSVCFEMDPYCGIVGFAAAEGLEELLPVYFEPDPQFGILGLWSGSSILSLRLLAGFPCFTLFFRLFISLFFLRQNPSSIRSFLPFKTSLFARSHFYSSVPSQPFPAPLSQHQPSPAQLSKPPSSPPRASLSQP